MHPASLVDDGQSLSLQQRMERAAGGVEAASARRLEFSSRGDRVCARLITPAGGGPHPVLVLVHAEGADKDSALPDPAALVAAGQAILAIDLPLHGERSSPKLSGLLLETLREGARDASAGVLLDQFRLQSESDVRRALDAVGALPELDADRIGLAGLGVGASIAARVGASDPRARAIVLADGDAAPLPEAMGASGDVEDLPPRPMLRIQPDDDAARAIADFLADSL